MTYGDLKFRLAKAFPGLDPTLIEGWIGDRYAEILSELPWQRLNVTGILQTVAPYTTGSVTLTTGSNVVTGLGTTFAAGMTGQGFRATGRDEFYEFTYVGATSATLDRPYEGPGGSAIGYSIFQSVYLMPADCRTLADNAFATFSLGPLKRLDRSQLNQSIPSRNISGTPQIWASYMDDASTPPRMQVELCPIPDTAIGIPFTYVADVSVPAQSAAFLAWVNPSALVEGVTARIKRHLKDYVGAQVHDQVAKASLLNMRTSEAQNMAPAQMQLSSFYTQHRAKRWMR